MNESKLGKLVTKEEGRDAIHVAIAPVEAGEVLFPGQHVSLCEGKAVDDKSRPYVGIALWIRS